MPRSTDPYCIGQKVIVRAEIEVVYTDLDGSDTTARELCSRDVSPWEGVVIGMRWRREGMIRCRVSMDDEQPYLCVSRTLPVVLVTRGLWHLPAEVMLSDLDPVPMLPGLDHAAG